MSIHLRIYDRRRTFMVRLRRREMDTATRQVWFAIHARPKNWANIFSHALDLLMEEPEGDEHDVTFAGGSARIGWKRSGFWTIIHVELGAYSRKKRQLIAAALFKAGRYAPE